MLEEETRSVTVGFEPDRFELAALFLIIRFINVYQTFIFCTVLSEVHKTFEKRLNEVWSWIPNSLSDSL